MPRPVALRDRRTLLEVLFGPRAADEMTGDQDPDGTGSTPDDVRMILIDPKMVEMGQYERVPHLLTAVVTDPKDLKAALDGAMAFKGPALVNVKLHHAAGRKPQQFTWHGSPE